MVHEPVGMNGTKWEWHEGSREWYVEMQWDSGHRVQISYESGRILKGVQEVNNWIEGLRNREVQLKEEAVDTWLLELFNDEWNEEEEPMSREAFIKHMKVESIRRYRDGKVIISFDVGDLFGWHQVVLQMDSNGEMIGYDLIG